MEFANKEYLFLLLLLVPYILWYLLYRKKTEPTMRMSDTFAYQYAPKSLRQRLTWLPAFLRMITFCFIVFALASMLARDLKPSRIDAAKAVAGEFISGRQDDNIGLTIFAGEAFTQCPMTTDHQSLLNLLGGVRTDLAERGLIEDGTAIGMGLANAVSRLKESKTKSKVVILLTDGSNNMGDISPLTAAQIAKSLGIRVYTIAVGSKTVAPYPMQVGGTIQLVDVRVDVDEETLRQIASTADGHFYRATNTDELKKIYKDIDQLEKSKMEIKKYSKRYEAFVPFTFVALFCLVLELLLRITWFRRIP